MSRGIQVIPAYLPDFWFQANPNRCECPPPASKNNFHRRAPELFCHVEKKATALSECLIVK
jgi:hypothetical protein